MKLQFALLTVCILLQVSCKKVDEFTKFDMEYEETVVIPSSTGLNLPFNVISPDVETNSESTFKVNDTRKDLVEEITIKSVDMSVSSPDNGDFSFLNSIEVYMLAEGLQEIKVAWKENIPDAQGKSLSLNVSDANLKEYIKKETFDLKVKTVTDEYLTSDYHVVINTVFFVDAKVLGQ